MGSSNQKANNKNKEAEEQTHPLPVQQAKAISPRMYRITQNIIAHCQSKLYNQIETELKSITYTFPQSPLSLCLKTNQERTLEFISVYSCPECFGQELLLCKSCFGLDLKKHEGHSYTSVQSSNSKACACGNSERSNPTVVCINHTKLKLMQSENEVLLFRREIKFLFSLALFIKKEAEIYKVTQENLVILGKALLQFISGLIKNSNMTAKLIQEILMEIPDRFNKEDMINEKEQITIFEEIVSFAQGDGLLAMIADLLQSVMRVDASKDGFLRLMYKYILSAESFSLEVTALFKKVGLTVANFPKSYQRFFSNKANCLVQMPLLNVQNEEFVVQKYSILSKQLSQLERMPNSLSCFLQIFECTKLSGLFNFQVYYFNNNDASEEINKMGLQYTLIMIKIIKKIARANDGMKILFKLLNECFRELIERTSQTFNRVFQRLFASIAFELFFHSLPSKNQICNVLGKIDYSVLKKLLLDFVNFKIIFQNEYKELILHCNLPKPSEKENIAQMKIVALDQFYFRIITSCMEQEDVQSLYREYLHEKIGEMGEKVQSHHHVKENLRKIAQFMSVLSVSMPSNMPELILSANSDKPDLSTQILLKNLLYFLDGTISATFKQRAETFIESQEAIINFIKRDAMVENKKIRCKFQQMKCTIGLSPDAQYVNENTEFEQYERMINCREKAEKCGFADRFFDEKNVWSFIQLWKKYGQMIANPDFLHQNPQDQLIATVQTLCNIYMINKSAIILTLIEQFSKKVKVPSSKLQAYIKCLLNKEMIDEKEQSRQLSEKKKKKLDAMKEKQKVALQSFKIQDENKVDLECIFCKNSSEGEPYLLGHFRYNNFYSKKILQMDAPFMEFTTCGHSAHEKCLTEMHKGEFRIWYPCILCKSITNILLPFTSSKLDDKQRLEKVLDFLKNFAATYTFFFQNRKQLMEFGLNEISGVYKLLFKTIIYSLTIYPIVNHSYFLRNQFPILKFIFDLLKFTHKKVKNLTFSANYQLKANNELTNIFHYHRYQLELLITNNFSNLALQRKIDEHRDEFSEDLTEMFDQIYQNLNDEKQGFNCQLKDPKFREMIRGMISKPPYDLQELRNLKKKCKSCQSIDEQFQLCLLCDWSCCSKCNDVRKVHAVEEHIGQTVFINGLTGQYTYLHQQLTGEFNSIYVDYLGHQARNKKNIVAGEFTLNEASWSKIVNDIVCNRLHKQLMRLKG